MTHRQQIHELHRAELRSFAYLATFFYGLLGASCTLAGMIAYFNGALRLAVLIGVCILPIGFYYIKTHQYRAQHLSYARCIRAATRMRIVQIVLTFCTSALLLLVMTISSLNEAHILAFISIKIAFSFSLSFYRHPHTAYFVQGGVIAMPAIYLTLLGGQANQFVAGIIVLFGALIYIMHESVRNLIEDQLHGAQVKTARSDRALQDLEALLALSQQYSLSLSQDLHISDVSENFCTMAQNQRRRLVNTPFTALLQNNHTGNTENLIRLSQAIQAKHSFANIEFCLIPRSGKTVIIQLTGMPKTNSAAAAPNYRAWAKDVTDTHARDKKIYAEYERYADIAELSAVAVWETDCTHAYTFATGEIFHWANMSARALLGAPFPWGQVEGQEEGQGDGQVLRQERGHETENELSNLPCTTEQTSLFHRIMQAREPFDTLEFRAPNGSMICLSGTPLYSPAGVFLGYRGIAKISILHTPQKLSMDEHSIRAH